MQMPEMKWHQLGLPCLKCTLPCTITSVSISSDGETLFGLCCVQCGKEYHWQSSWAKMVAQALYSDIQEEKKKQKPSRPLLLAGNNKQDNDFLHEMGIGGLE